MLHCSYHQAFWWICLQSKTSLQWSIAVAKPCQVKLLLNRCPPIFANNSWICPCMLHEISFIIRIDNNRQINEKPADKDFWLINVYTCYMMVNISGLLACSITTYCLIVVNIPSPPINISISTAMDEAPGPGSCQEYWTPFSIQFVPSPPIVLLLLISISSY